MLNRHAAAVKVTVIYREYVISNAKFFRWKAKYGGLDARQFNLMKELPEEKAASNAFTMS